MVSDPNGPRIQRAYGPNGSVRAEAIVAYREANGRFLDAYDLANVKGIGDRTVELNEERIRLED